MRRHVSDAQFHADQIDQMDLALDQLALRDRNYDRFALLLIDNVMELGLHRFAESKCERGWRDEPEPRTDVREALGNRFDKKVALARREGLLDEAGESIGYLHDFRNKAHHAGVRHEGILHSIALLYFKVVCTTMSALTRTDDWSDYSSTVFPHRATKYLGRVEVWGGVAPQRFHQAWLRLSDVAASMGDVLVLDLHRDLTALVEAVDRDLTFLAEEGRDKRTRNDAVVWVQLRRIWNTPEGDAVIERNRSGKAIATVADAMNCLKTDYEWQTKVDPLPGWRKNLRSLGEEKSPHFALKKYCDFILRNESLMEEIARSASELQEGLDRAEEEAHDEGR